jgi:hypothetical protein
MAPIPLTLVGILPAHMLMDAFVTATSMIGFIAGAGIIVRNSIILVDFIELRRAQGMALKAAVGDAGAVRFRPMLLTAGAVVVRRERHLIRSDFSTGIVADGRGSSFNAALAHDCAGAVLHGGKAQTTPGDDTGMRAETLGGRFLTVVRPLRMIAGAFVVLSLALGYWVSPYGYLFTAFLRLNLFQSAFTNWCPMMTILRKARLR